MEDTETKLEKRFQWKVGTGLLLMIFPGLK